MFQKGCASRYGKGHFFTNTAAPLSYSPVDQLHGFCANPLREYAEDKATASRAKFEQEQHIIQEKEDHKRVEEIKQKNIDANIQMMEERKRLPQSMSIDNMPSDRLLKKPKTEDEIRSAAHEKMEIQSEEPLSSNQRVYYTEILSKK
jgi:hypothetical protein